MIPAVNHRGVRVMVWGCFAFTGPGQLVITGGVMDSAPNQKIFLQNICPSVHDLKLKHKWVLQHDNDAKHTSKSTSELLRKNKIKVLE